MSIDKKVDAVFETNRLHHQNSCWELRTILSKMIKYPGIYDGR